MRIKAFLDTYARHPAAAPLYGLSIRRQPLNTLQVNLGYRCNQSCVPRQCWLTHTEMEADTVDLVIEDAAGAEHDNGPYGRRAGFADHFRRHGGGQRCLV
jgi:hypothetical protein